MSPKKSPKAGQAGKEKTKKYALPPELEGMAEIAAEFQKAIVSWLPLVKGGTLLVKKHNFFLRVLLSNIAVCRW